MSAIHLKNIPKMQLIVKKFLSLEVNKNRNAMKLLDFYKVFPDEESCEKYLRYVREKSGIECRCGCHKMYWNKSKKSWICSSCGHEIRLKSGTVMQNSKLPLLYWFFAIHLLTATKKSFSTREIQHQLGHKRYQPIWEMIHKLRSVMGKRDDSYELTGSVEIDDGFFSTQMPEDEKDKQLKRGRGSQKKTAVLVMVESKESDNKQGKSRSVGHLKMKVLPDMSSDSATDIATDAISLDGKLLSDASTSYHQFKDCFMEHSSKVIDKKDIGKVLPWVHVTISNAKRLLLDIYHDVSAELLQYYLDEFCYKFNRRYFGDKLFDRLVVAAVSYQPDFKHRIYSRA